MSQNLTVYFSVYVYTHVYLFHFAAYLKFTLTVCLQNAHVYGYFYDLYNAGDITQQGYDKKKAKLLGPYLSAGKCLYLKCYVQLFSTLLVAMVVCNMCVGVFARAVCVS